jgi:hypothetical protein
VSLPLLLCAAIWLSLLESGSLDASHRARLGGLAGALAVAVLLTAVAFSGISARFPRSALGEVMPRGASPTAALRELWHPAPLNESAPVGEELLAHYMPGQRRVLILLSPDLATEILLRSGRANELPFTDPREDSYDGQPSDSALEAAVARLHAGQRLLLQDLGLQVARLGRREPGADFSTDPPVDVNQLVPAQQEAIALIARRFGLRVLDREDGYVVVQLAPRASG